MDGKAVSAGSDDGCDRRDLFASVTTAPWAWGVALFALAWAWASAAGMALYFILRGQIQMHKEWMVRACVITFAFVTFRILNDYGPTSHLQPLTDRIVTLAWISWTLPLFVTEMILQLRRARKSTAVGNLP